MNFISVAYIKAHSTDSDHQLSLPEPLPDDVEISTAQVALRCALRSCCCCAVAVAVVVVAAAAVVAVVITHLAI